MSILDWLQGAVMWIHIDAGAIALMSGGLAIAVRKGGRTHVLVGRWFVGSILVLGITATVLAALKEEPDLGLGGIAASYLALTGWMSGRRRDGRAGTFEVAACAAALSIAALIAWDGVMGATTPAGRGPVFALAALCLLAGLGDLKTVLRQQLTAAQRLSRHVWRICAAFFMATGSFFIGQQDVMPEEVSVTLHGM